MKRYKVYPQIHKVADKVGELLAELRVYAEFLENDIAYFEHMDDAEWVDELREMRQHQSEVLGLINDLGGLDV